MSFIKNMESNNPFMRNVITTLHIVLLTSIYFYLNLIIEKFGIIKMQAQRVFQKQFQTFDWPKGFRNKKANENCKFFRKYIPHKTRNLNTRPPSG